MESPSNIELLFTKYLSGIISSEEYQQFWQELRTADIQTLSPQLQTLWTQTEGIAPHITDEEWNTRLKALIQKAEEEDAAWKKFRERKIRRIPAWTKWVAAASIILIIGVAVVVGVLTNNHNNNKPGVTVATDVPPPTNTRAVITLADGSKVYLDSAGNGVLAQENNVNVVRSADGIISYQLNRHDAKTQGTISYNTLFNPRGSKVISLTLSDGTKVWLNSESSLRYPASFAPSAVNREVEITGEAYFEVAHDASKPFHVKKGETDITVLGTHFNVNAYDDEEALKVTLLEGSVRVTAANTANAAVKLKPGEQAVLNQANSSISRIEVQTNVDVEEVMAWKNNRFLFKEAGIKDIMKQAARWYDVDVIYEDNINETFNGGISRTVNASQLFRILETTGKVKFEISGKKVVVKASK